MSEDRRPELILLTPRADVAGHLRPLLEADGYQVLVARTAEHASDLLRASRARIVLASEVPAPEMDAFRAQIDERRPDVDVLTPPGFGRALIDGALDRRRTVQLATDAMHFLGTMVEKAVTGPAVVDKASQLAEMTARRLNLGRLHVEAIGIAAVLAALGPRLARFRFLQDTAGGAEGGIGRDLLAAKSAAAMLRSPYNLQEILGSVDERFDGRGRPRGLVGDRIPIAARVVTVIRDYVIGTAGGDDGGGTVQKITARAGNEYDPRVVDALFRVVRDTEYVNRLTEGKADVSVAVVDGDAAALAVAELALSGAGFAVRSYTDGRLADDAINKDPPQAIISEVTLPRFDGFSLLLKSRRNPALSDVPFYFATATCDRLTAAKALKLGATDVLAKPVNFDVLCAKLRDATKKVATQQAMSQSGRHQAVGLQGNLAEMALTDLLQVIAFGRKTAAIHLQSQTASGSISLEHGEPVAAFLGELAGRPAFCEMASWQEGAFRLDTAAAITDRNLDGNLESLLLEALRIMDERGKQASGAG